MCLENFSSQIAERHNKPEVEVRYAVDIGTYQDEQGLIMPPYPILRNQETQHWACRTIVQPDSGAQDVMTLIPVANCL
jgi:hypothetical protein